MGEREQLLLVPAEQRRHQQAGEAEVVVRLHREADRGEQVLDRQRLVQVQAVDPGDRHAAGEQPGDDQRGQRAAAADQHHHVAGRELAAGGGEDRAFLDQPLDSLGEVVGVEPGAELDPALLAFLAAFVGLLGGERRPQLDLAGAVGMKGAVAVGELAKPHRFGLDVGDHRIDDVEDRLRRAEAGGDRQVAEVAGQLPRACPGPARREGRRRGP